MTTKTKNPLAILICRNCDKIGEAGHITKLFAYYETARDHSQATGHIAFAFTEDEL